MKTKLCLLFIMLISAITIAQNGINYKAIIKDGGGNVIANDLIIVQFTIIKTTAAGATVYQENHSPVTDNNGVIIVNIGEGTPLSGVFTDVAWTSDKHFLNVQINTGSGLVDLGTTEFKAVPYALNVTGLEKITEGGNTGWRLIGQDPADYADIGNNAVDLSTQSVMPNIGASGSSAFAVGVDTYSEGTGTAAFGLENVASGIGSIVGGFDSLATGDHSFAIGNNAIAEGRNSAAFGGESSATGINSFAIGSGSEADGNESFAGGEFATATGDGTFAYNGMASGNYAYTFGGTASGDASFAVLGEAIGAGSVALGNVIVSSPLATAVGKFNVDNIDAAFMVGTGTGLGDRKNALTVEKSGDVGFGTSTPSHPVHIVHNTTTANAISVEAGSPLSSRDVLEIKVDAATSDSAQFIEMERGTAIVAAINTDGSAKFKSVQFEDNSVQTTAAIGPVAYGFVTTVGTTPSGSGNYSVIWSAANNRYEITITGEAYFWQSYTTNVTSSTSSVDRIRVSSVSGKLLVYLTNSTGTLVQGNFQFITYK